MAFPPNFYPQQWLVWEMFGPYMPKVQSVSQFQLVKKPGVRPIVIHTNLCAGERSKPRSGEDGDGSAAVGGRKRGTGRAASFLQQQAAQRLLEVRNANISLEKIAAMNQARIEIQKRAHEDLELVTLKDTLREMLKTIEEGGLSCKFAGRVEEIRARYDDVLALIMDRSLKKLFAPAVSPSVPPAASSNSASLASSSSVMKP